MKEYIDQMNNTIRLAEAPSRIVSLVPSQTQLLHALGLENEVVGITKFCIHPDSWFRAKNRIGGTKSVNIDKVRALKPDLIFANKEENTKEDIDVLSEIAPVWLSNISNLDDSLSMIKSFGEIVNRVDNASLIIQKIRTGFERLDNLGLMKRSVIYFIWNEPGYTAGKGTFIDDMLSRCGLENAVKTSRYPEVPANLSPELILLSSEPFPFKEKHLELYHKLYPESKVKIVDGEMFSWYGSKLIESPSYFESLLAEI